MTIKERVINLLVEAKKQDPDLVVSDVKVVVPEELPVKYGGGFLMAVSKIDYPFIVTDTNKAEIILNSWDEIVTAVSRES